MPEEAGTILNSLEKIEKKIFGDLEIFSGVWKKKDKNNKDIFVSVAWSGWGKVSAARAATRIIGISYKESSINFLLFTGVAGAVEEKLRQWDIIVTTSLIQHDMDARPIFEKYEIPALRTKFIIPETKWLNWSIELINNSIKNKLLNEFGRVHSGVIATGDKFVDDVLFANNLKKDIKGLLAVEMEGAAVAQVATQESIPWQIIRVVSDSADQSSEQNFDYFIKKYNNYSANLISAFLDNIEEAPI